MLKGKLQPLQLLSPPCQPSTLTTGELHNTGRVHASTAQQLLSEVSHLRSTKLREVKCQCPRKAPHGQHPAAKGSPAQANSRAAAPSAHASGKDPGEMPGPAELWVHHQLLQLLPVLVLPQAQLGCFLSTPAGRQHHRPPFPSTASLFPHRLHGASSNDDSTAFFHNLGKVDSWIQQEEFEAALTNCAWEKQGRAFRS